MNYQGIHLLVVVGGFIAWIAKTLESMSIRYPSAA